MKASLRTLAKHVPLIRFPNRQASAKIDPTPKPHPCSSGLMPGDLSKAAAGSAAGGAPSKAKVELRSELPPRFRYKPLEDIEIEDVNLGGAEVLFK